LAFSFLRPLHCYAGKLRAFGKLAAQKIAPRSTEGHEVKKDFVQLFHFFVIFVPFVVSYSSELVAALPR
jgi:hypothetical protein